MAHPESIIAPDGTAAQTRLLLRATESLNAAVAALQEATNLLEEKARQLHTHEAVMADRDHAGHFVPGVGFTYDPETRRHPPIPGRKPPGGHPPKHELAGSTICGR